MSVLRPLGQLAPKSTALFVCDMQEAFRKTIQYYPEIICNTVKLAEAAKLLDVPIIVTEQYPRGGSTRNDSVCVFVYQSSNFRTRKNCRRSEISVAGRNEILWEDAILNVCSTSIGRDESLREGCHWRHSGWHWVPCLCFADDFGSSGEEFQRSYRCWLCLVSKSYRQVRRIPVSRIQLCRIAGSRLFSGSTLWRGFVKREPLSRLVRAWCCSYAKTPSIRLSKPSRNSFQSRARTQGSDFDLRSFYLCLFKLWFFHWCYNKVFLEQANTRTSSTVFRVCLKLLIQKYFVADLCFFSVLETFKSEDFFVGKNWISGFPGVRCRFWSLWLLARCSASECINYAS